MLCNLLGFTAMLRSFTRICDNVIQFYSDLRQCIAILLWFATMLCNFTLNRDNVMHFFLIGDIVLQIYSMSRDPRSNLEWRKISWCARYKLTTFFRSWVLKIIIKNNDIKTSYTFILERKNYHKYWRSQLLLL